MVVSGVFQVAVVMEQTVFDSLIDGPILSAVAAGHNSHVVVMDVAVANGHMVRLVDADTGAVVGAVVGFGEFEAFEEAVIRSRVELEDRPWDPPAATVVESSSGDLDPFLPGSRDSPKDQARDVHLDCNLLVRLPVSVWKDKNEVPGLSMPVCVLYAGDLLTGPTSSVRAGTARLQSDRSRMVPSSTKDCMSR